ncbi:SigE family RNA polymerase sigma factor [Nocardioides bigeumensis]|uniref:SigE family RNA polymerase sigma factor n=1 Tax=Nocardioides bigeumensis TaxID=433657 RepID=A0ABP5JYQ1_9ACTN
MGRPRGTSAFTELVEHRGHALLRTAYLLVGDHQLAEDLLQEALVKTLIALPRIRDISRIEGYVRQTMVRTVIGWRRRRSFHERPSDALPEAPIDDGADVVATHQLLVAHLRGLPPRQRTAIVLRYYEDLSVAQTAELMDCSVGAVKSHVSTGLARLRERMGPSLDLVPTGEEELTS